MEKTINNKQLVEAAKNVPIIAEKEHWVLTFDKDEGALFYSPEKISDGAVLHQITDEYALYLDKNLKPQGMMIECFKENFLEHHKFFKQLSEDIFNRKEAIVVLNPKTKNKNKGTVAILAGLLESTLIKEAGARLIPA